MSASSRFLDGSLRYPSLKHLMFSLLLLCFASDLFFSYFPIGPVPVRNYLWGLGLTLILLIWLLKASLYIRLGYPEKIILLLSVLGVTTTILNVGLSLEVLVSLIRVLLIPYGIFVLATFVFNLSVSFVRLFIAAVVLLTAFSALIALLQWLNVGFAWELRQSMPASSDDIGSTLLNALNGRHRPYGMSYFPISLAYQVCWAFPLAWYVAERSSNFPLFIRRLGAISALLLLLAVFASGTRSASIALIVQLIIIMWAKGYVSLRLRSVIPIVVVLSAVLIGVLYIQSDRWLLNDSSALSRYWLLYVGVLFIFDNPLGQGFDWSVYNAFKQSFLASSPFLDASLAAEIRVNAPHNQFINTAIYYGWTGVLFVLAFYYWIIRKLFSISRETKLIQNYLPHALLAGFSGYLVNSMFHNAGLFVGDHLGWYFLALSCWVIKKRTVLRVNSDT